MKKIFLCLCAIVMPMFARATTVNLNWLVGETTWAQTTCESGGDLNIPTPNPTKYGYTFRGWIPFIRLEYIESTGTQYIDTGFSPDANTSVDWKGQLISGTSGVLLGARVNSSIPGRFLPFAFSSSASYRTVYGYGEAIVSASTSTVCTGSFRPSESKSIINGTTYSFVSPDFSKTESNNLLLFGVSGYGDAHYLSTGKIWYVKIWDNNTLVRDFVPVKRAYDNAIGMYDTVSRQFFTNAGTGEFIAGPVVGALAE